MGQINESDETLMAICAEAQGCFELDPESIEPSGNCVFARLIREGYASSSLASADEKGALSMDLYTARSTPKTDPDTAINKM